MIEVTCSKCGGQVAEEAAYRLVTGWERHRSAGGTNAIALRQPLNEYACDPCIWRMKRGIDPTQSSLFRVSGG